MNTLLVLFILLSITVLLAWFKHYRLSIVLFLVFLLAACGVFAHDITEALNIQL